MFQPFQIPANTEVSIVRHVSRLWCRCWCRRGTLSIKDVGEFEFCWLNPNEEQAQLQIFQGQTDVCSFLLRNDIQQLAPYQRFLIEALLVAWAGKMACIRGLTSEINIPFPLPPGCVIFDPESE